jgi:nicotinate-nucleotide pyrophosphorylase (carboxylating)
MMSTTAFSPSRMECRRVAPARVPPRLHLTSGPQPGAQGRFCANAALVMNHSFILSPAELSPLEVDRIVELALAEDLAAGDVTTRTVVPPDALARGTFSAREPMVLAGLSVAARVFARVDPRVTFTPRMSDGAALARGAVVASIEGPAHGVLTGERSALNLLQRMCGVATLTRRYVDALGPGSRARITDTRKTNPGLRALDRYAVRAGGGHNHRNDLSSAVLIKDNHVAVCGGVRPAIERARRAAPHTMRIECEVQSLAQLDEALAAGVDVLMLDNFDDALTLEALRRIRALAHQPVVEVSGGLTLERIPALAAMGVDVLSIGALTHGARAVDIGLDLEVTGAWADAAP